MNDSLIKQVLLLWVALAFMAVGVLFTVTEVISHRNDQNNAFRNAVCFIQKRQLHPKKPAVVPNRVESQAIIQFWISDMEAAHLPILPVSCQ